MSLQFAAYLVDVTVITWASCARKVTRAQDSSLRERAGNFQIRELGHRVGLRPEPDPALRETLLFVIEEERVVQIGLDLRPLRDDADPVPFTQLRFGHPGGRNRASPAVDDRVQPKVVFEGVG